MARTKGAYNKSTLRARAAIGRLVDSNSERLESWLDQIAENDGPMAAWKCFMDVVEYHIPKLARTEVVGDKDQPVQIVVETGVPRGDTPEG